MNKQTTDYQWYKKIRLLGKGDDSQAFLVESIIDGALCVIKEVKLIYTGSLIQNMKEYKALEPLKHPNLVEFREVFLIRRDIVCIVMDFANDKPGALSLSIGDSLKVKVKDRMDRNFTEDRILDWFTQICLAIKYLHDKKMAFVDLTLDNIFLTSTNVIKIGDVALAEVFSNIDIDIKTKPNFTTPSYLSPTSLITDSSEGLENNIKALGVILYQLCTLRVDSEEIVDASIPDFYSFELKNLMATLLGCKDFKGLRIDSILENDIIKPRVQGLLSRNIDIQKSWFIPASQKRPKDIRKIAEREQLDKIKFIKKAPMGPSLVVKNPKSSQLYIIRQIRRGYMPEDEREKLIRESKAYKFLSHKYITRLRGLHLCRYQQIYKVVDYAHGGSLAAKIKKQEGKPFPEEQILDWLTQICLALKYLHNRKVAHKGLITKNIYLGLNNAIKLKDVASVEMKLKVTDYDIMHNQTICGFSSDFCIEVMNGKPYDLTSDIWALGVVLYELCTLKYPFEEKNQVMLHKQIFKEQYTPIPSFVSKDVISLITSLLHVKSSERPTVDDVLNNPVVKPRIEKHLNKQYINAQAEPPAAS